MLKFPIMKCLMKNFMQQPTNCLSVFDHFVGLALKGLKRLYHYRSYHFKLGKIVYLKLFLVHSLILYPKYFQKAHIARLHAICFLFFRKTLQLLSIWEQVRYVQVYPQTVSNNKITFSNPSYGKTTNLNRRDRLQISFLTLSEFKRIN